MSIEVNNLTKIYGKQKAVNNISFSVAKGEIVGFLGRNGAGKSTTMKIITGYLQASEGHVKVCDMAVEENSIGTKQKIGYLPESNALYYDMYVREYLSFVARIHNLADVATAVEDTIQKVGLTVEANKKIGQLSKGYKQRVGLAAAIIHNHEVLILDEPTSGLDPTQIVEIRNVIKELGKDKTILFSSHILQEVQALCERVIIIKKGQLVADDQLSNLGKSNDGQQFIQIQFAQAVQQALFNNIEGVNAVQSLGNNAYRLACTQKDLVKKALLQIAIDQNLDITNLQTEAQSLEDIFKSLTD